MEYSLYTLNQNSKLNSLKITEIVNQLNLIGFEVDDIFTEKSMENLFFDNVRLLIKIPANREDLLNEKFLLIELSTVLLFQLNNFWKKIKPNYFFLLKENYLKYFNYETVNIQQKNVPEILIYNIQLKNIKNLSSPLWIQNKLINLGFLPKKNIEDLITLANIEWGQNFNFYISKNSPFIIETLNKQEEFLDINNFSHLLFPGTIVLKDKYENILTVLGLINTKKNLESFSNSEIFFQSIFYNFNFQKRDEKSSQLNKTIFLRSFRKIFLENFKYSFQRLLTLLEIISSGSIIPKIYSNIGNSIKLNEQKILKCRQKSLKNVLNLTKYDFSIFEKSGLKIICQTKNDFYFLIPNYRNDLEREIDLIEEYSRFIGYKNFIEIFPEKVKQNVKKNSQNNELIKQFFINSSFNEIITNPILDIKKQQHNSICLNNPLNNEFLNLRTNIFFKLLDIYQNNLNLGFEQKNFFEIGRTFKKIKNRIVESDKVAGIFQLERTKKSLFLNSEWFIAKGFLENFLALFDHQDVKIETNPFSLNLFHETKSIIFKSKNDIIGIFGELNPSLDFLKLTKYPVYLFEFDLQFFKNWRRTKKIQMYKEYSKYPSIFKDLSFKINKTINFYLLKQRFLELSLKLKRVEFFDLYFDEKISQEINIGIRLEFQSNLQTFTNEEIEQEINYIKEKMEKEFFLQFR
jgi:phenylalanyl-tRNA synthetase beta chain